MSRLIPFILGMLVYVNPGFSQDHYALNGEVLNGKNEPLLGASVILQPIQMGTATDDKGHYHFTNVPWGEYQISISYIGYETLVDTVAISGNTRYDAMLAMTSVNLQEVVVTDHYIEQRKREAALNIEIVSEDFLKQNLGGSLMTSLERLPGVTTIGISSGQSKPVIRGLAFNRVVVVENDIKHEAQQWGADHGLEVDQFAVDNVEVIKGPASLMYGSDAIGGVINMNSRKYPVENTYGGSMDLTGASNNGLLGTSVSVYGRHKSIFITLRGTLQDFGDSRVPADSVDIYSYRAALHEHHLRNTAGGEKNVHASLGLITDSFLSKVYLSNVNSEAGFFANAHGLEPRSVDTELYDSSNRDILYPYQTVNHFKLISTTELRRNASRVEFSLGYQNNFREEFSHYVQHGYMPALYPDTLTFASDLERQFDKDVYSGNLFVVLEPSVLNQISLGVNGEIQENRIHGRGFIIPAFEQEKLGSFITLKRNLSNVSILHAGMRYDIGHISIHRYEDWFPSPVISGTDTNFQYLQRSQDMERDFSNLTWSVGLNHNPGNLSYKFNVGKSFRIPIAKELAANGVNYHRFSYDVGDPEISPEESYQLDLGLEYSADKLAIGASPFLNYFSNYIYLNPSSDHDRLYGNGNQIFYYTQAEVLRYGLELHAHYEPVNTLKFGLIGEYVYSEQLSGEKMGFTLPYSPPASLILNLTYRKHMLRGINEPYVSLDYRMTAAQNHIVPPEEKTPGHQVLDLAMGGMVELEALKFDLSLQIQNLSDRKYFNHTSFNRLINVPEQGRNIVVNMSVPFSGKLTP